MELQKPRKHRRRLLTPPSRNAPRPGCVRALLRSAAHQVIRLTQACCTRPRHAPAPTQEPRPLTSEEVLAEKQRVAEQIAREISEDSMSRYSWTRITRNRIPSISRLATESSSSDSWLQPRNCPKSPVPPPVAPPRRRRTQPVKRATALCPDDVIDAAAPSRNVSVHSDTSVAGPSLADEDLDASEITSAISNSPVSETSDSEVATSSEMPGTVPSSDLPITQGVPDMAIAALGVSDSSIASSSSPANTTASQSGTPETVSQRRSDSSDCVQQSRDPDIDSEYPVPKSRKSKRENNKVVNNLANNDAQFLPSSVVKPDPTTVLLVDTVTQNPRDGSRKELFNEETVIQDQSAPGEELGHSESGITYSEYHIALDSMETSLVDSATLGQKSPHQIPMRETSSVETFPCASSISEEEHDVKSTEKSKAGIQVFATRKEHEHSMTMTSFMSPEVSSCTTVSTQSETPLFVDMATQIASQQVSSCTTVSTQSETPLLVDMATQIAFLKLEEKPTVLPTDDLSCSIVNLVQNSIIIPTKGKSSQSDTVWIENRVQQLLSEVHHMVQGHGSLPLHEEVQFKENVDQHKANGSVNSADISEELAKATTDVDNSCYGTKYTAVNISPVHQLEGSQIDTSTDYFSETHAECRNIEVAGVPDNKRVPHQTEEQNVSFESKPQPVTNLQEHETVKDEEQLSAQGSLDEKCVTEYSPMHYLIEEPVSERQQIYMGMKNVAIEGQESTEDCMADYYLTTSSDEEDLPSHKTSREIFSSVKVNGKGMDNETSYDTSSQSGPSSQPNNMTFEDSLMDTISISSSDAENDNVLPKTSREIFGHVNIEGKGKGKGKKVSPGIHLGSGQFSETQDSKDFEGVMCSKEDQQKPVANKDVIVKLNPDSSDGMIIKEQNGCSIPENTSQDSDQAQQQGHKKVSLKTSRERFGKVMIDGNPATLKHKKSVKDSSSSKQRSDEWHKCLNELRAALCSDDRDGASFSRKTSRERFGHVKVDCTSDEKTHRNGMNDPNQGVHHHHSDISFDEAGPSQPRNGPPDKSSKGKSVKFIRGFELPMTSHYGFNDRETSTLKSLLKTTHRDSPRNENEISTHTTHGSNEITSDDLSESSKAARETFPLKSALKATHRDSPRSENVISANTSHGSNEIASNEFSESSKAARTSSQNPQTSAPKDTILSDLPSTSTDENQSLPVVRNQPKVVRSSDGYSYPSVVVPIISSEEVEWYKEEDEDTKVLLGIGSYGYCEAAKYSCPDGPMISVSVKLCYDTDDQPSLIREGKFSQYLKDTGVFPEFYGYLYLNIDSRLVIGLVSELYAEGNTLAGLLRNHRILLQAREWISICIQLAKGLQIIHQSHVLLNDLKSNNILVDVQDQAHPVIKFIDLGLASYKYGVVHNYRREDVQGLRHLAPEVKRGHVSSKYSDIWALGALYWEIYDYTQIQGIHEVSTSALITHPWRRPSLDTIIETLEGVAKKIF